MNSTKKCYLLVKFSFDFNKFGSIKKMTTVFQLFVSHWDFEYPCPNCFTASLLRKFIIYDECKLSHSTYSLSLRDIMENCYNDWDNPSHFIDYFSMIGGDKLQKCLQLKYSIDCSNNIKNHTPLLLWWFSKNPLFPRYQNDNYQNQNKPFFCT